MTHSHVDPRPSFPRKRESIDPGEGEYGVIIHDWYKLSLLNDKTVLDVDLGLVIQDMTIRQLISTSFDEIADAGKRFESVATSKMIHAAVNLELFVMWDTRIASAHRVGANGDNYAHFLTLIQGQIEEAIGQVSIAENLTREGAITSLTPCGHTLAKVIDEFNYVCFTVRDDDVRQLAGYPLRQRL